MEVDKILTREKAHAMYEKIAKGLKKNKIVGSAEMIDDAIREAWLVGFEEGRNHELGQFPDRPSSMHET